MGASTFTSSNAQVASFDGTGPSAKYFCLKCQPLPVQVSYIRNVTGCIVEKT